MRKAIGAICLFGLCACLPIAGAAPAKQLPQTPDTCGIAVRAVYVGQPIAALVTNGLAGGVRIIRPGDAVTEDYSDTRLNADLDASDTITRLWCG